MNAVSHLFRGHAITYPSQKLIDQYVGERAEWLSRDLYSLPEICRRMDISQATGCALLRILCERMGESVH